MTVAAAMPPTTARPMAWRLAAPAPEATTSGMKPVIEEIEVIRMGRKRYLAASTAASRMPRPLARCSLANSTIKMAFLLARAMSSTMPIWV